MSERQWAVRSVAGVLRVVVDPVLERVDGRDPGEELHPVVGELDARGAGRVGLVVVERAQWGMVSSSMLMLATSANSIGALR
jgi:hypothetical protein